MSQATTTRPPAARAARPASLRAVPTTVGRSRRGMFAVVCMSLLAVGLLALLLLNTALAQGAFQLSGLTQTSSALTDEEHALRQRVDSQSSSAALAQRAVSMGMVPARSMAFLRLSDGAILGVAEPAKAEPFTVVTVPRPAPPPPEPPPAPAEQTSSEPTPADPAPAEAAPGETAPAEPTPAATATASPGATTTATASAGATPTATTSPGATPTRATAAPRTTGPTAPGPR